MERVFLLILSMSITAALLAVAVLALRVFLRKAPKALFCILWGFVAIRLICPISFESPFSLIPAPLTTSDSVLDRVDFEKVRNVTVFESEPISTEVLNTLTAEAATASGALSDTLSASAQTSAQTPTDSLIAPAPITDAVITEENISFLKVLSFVATVLWPLGVAVMLLYAAISYLRIRRKTAEAVYLKDNIWLCDRVASPFILGTLRPRIILPSSIQPEEAEHVIAHEQAHLKRLDHFWKPLGFVLLSVYWFNPVLWIAYIFLCKDIELACDERVIRKMNTEEIKSYSSTLLNYSISRKMISVCPLAFGEVHVKKRIKNVLHYKRPAFWVILLAVVSCIAVAVCFLTNPVKPKTETGQVSSEDKDEEYRELAASEGNLPSGTVAAWKNTALLSDYYNPKTPTPRSIVWVNYFYNRTKNPDGPLIMELPEFPDVTFYVDSHRISADTPEGSVTLLSGHTLWTTYLTDVNDDSYPDICATVSYDSAPEKLGVVVYDFKNRMSYNLSDSSRYDFTIFGNEDSMFVQRIDRKKEQEVFIGTLHLTHNPEQNTATIEITEAEEALYSRAWTADNQLSLMSYNKLYTDLQMNENRFALNGIYPICSILTEEDWEAFTTAYADVTLWMDGQLLSMKEALGKEVATSIEYCQSPEAAAYEETYPGMKRSTCIYLTPYGLAVGYSTFPHEQGFSSVLKEKENKETKKATETTGYLITLQ